MRFLPTASLLFFTILAVHFSGCKSSSTKSELPVVVEGNKTNFNLNMQNLRESLSRLEPFLVDEKKFSAAENESKLKIEINHLAELSQKVTHNPPSAVAQDPTVKFVSSQFSKALQRSAESFEVGRKEFARYELMRVTGFCIECHTRTQQGPQFEGPGQNKNLVSLSPLQMAEYLISARYFDEALVALEEVLKLPNESIGFSQSERAAKYGLMITVQFKQNPDSALAFIKKVEGSKNSSYALKQRVAQWRLALNSWKKELTQKNKQSSVGFSAFRQMSLKKESEVDQMRVLAGLLPWLAANPNSDDLGEGLFIVGSCYESLMDLSVFNLHENYFEACIQAVPHSTWAQKCYKKLEDSIRFGYSGSAGTFIPPEIKQHLDSMKALAL